LRHQLDVLNRSRLRRLRLVTAERWLWTWLSRSWPAWRTALVIVKPETVIAWHRQGFRLFWTWKSRRRIGRPTVSADVRALIRTMSEAHPLWGAPRIHGELLNDAPRYLVRDRDSAFHAWATTTQAMDIHELVTAARSPWQNAYVERLIGSIRRECLDHVIVWNERGLRRVLTAYVAYDSSSRTHLSLNKDAPISRHVASPADGDIVAIPQVGGLHHRYERRAA